MKIGIICKPVIGCGSEAEAIGDGGVKWVTWRKMSHPFYSRPVYDSVPTKPTFRVSKWVKIENIHE